MEIISRYRNKSFLKFTLFEHAIVTTLIGVGIPAILFFGIMLSGRRNSDAAYELIETIFTEDGLPLIIVVSVIALVVNAIILGIRNSELVVAAQLDDSLGRIRLEVRRKRGSSLRVVHVPYDQLVWRRTETAKIPGVPTYVGYEFCNEAVLVGLLLTDHFTWDDQQRRVKSFLSELNDRIPKT